MAMGWDGASQNFFWHVNDNNLKTHFCMTRLRHSLHYLFPVPVYLSLESMYRIEWSNDLFMELLGNVFSLESISHKLSDSKKLLFLRILASYEAKIATI